MWHKVLKRNHFLVNLYDQVPELNDVRIAEIKVYDEGRIVSIQFDMPYFADHPPAKWVEQGNNTVSVRVDFSAIQEFQLHSGTLDYKGTIRIAQDDLDIINVQITGTLNVLIKAESALVQSITGYVS